MNEQLKRVQWYQFSYNVYVSTQEKDLSKISVGEVQETKKEENQNFQKLGGDFDLAYFNGEFVLCINRDFQCEQPFVSFKTLDLQFGICQKIPYRNTFILDDSKVLTLLQKESMAIETLKQFNFFKPKEIYYGEIDHKIFLLFANNSPHDQSFALKKISSDIFLIKINLSVKSHGNHDVKPGWFPLGYPMHIGFIDKDTPVVFEKKTDKKQSCVNVQTGQIVIGTPKSLDETHSWYRLSGMIRKDLIFLIQESIKILNNSRSES